MRKIRITRSSLITPMNDSFLDLDLLARKDIQWADSCAAEGHSMIERIWREKRRMVSRNIAIGGTLRRAAFRALMAYETRNQRSAI